MSGKPLYAGAAVAVFLAAAARWCGWLSPGGPEMIFEPKTPLVKTAPLCPWREPDKDQREFFPGSVRYETETRILSGWRTELAERLGRMPTAEENALRLYRVFGPEKPMGMVLTSRVKGESGAIEIVLAVNLVGQVCGLRLQRLREPDSVSASLQQPAWLAAFDGLTAHSQWQLGRAIAQVPAPARASAAAVVQGVRSLLILLDTSSTRPLLAGHHRH